MTYGLYTPDLKGCAFSGQSLDKCRKYQHGEFVICTERESIYGFEFRFCWKGDGWRHFKFYRYMRLLELGPLSFSWCWCKQLLADKIIAGEMKDGK